jgi:phosphomannomutase
LGLSLHERPIGFKNIAEIMLQEELLIGGEESGGIGLSRHLPERDGIFINLLMLDLLAASGKSCTELRRDMCGRSLGSFIMTVAISTSPSSPARPQSIS